MLADLLSPPTTPEALNIWAFSNNQAILAIQAAIRVQMNVSLTQYALYPVDSIRVFLEANQQSHQDIMSTLNLQSADLEDVDFEQHDELRNWAYQCHRELYDAAAVLKVSV